MFAFAAPQIKWLWHAGMLGSYLCLSCFTCWAHTAFLHMIRSSSSSCTLTQLAPAWPPWPCKMLLSVIRQFSHWHNGFWLLWKLMLTTNKCYVVLQHDVISQTDNLQNKSTVAELGLKHYWVHTTMLQYLRRHSVGSRWWRLFQVLLQCRMQFLTLRLLLLQQQHVPYPIVGQCKLVLSVLDTCRLTNCMLAWCSTHGLLWSRQNKFHAAADLYLAIKLAWSSPQVWLLAARKLTFFADCFRGCI